MVIQKDLRRPARDRDVFRRAGEVAVSAYARQQRRRRIFLALVGVALIAGAGWLLAALWPREVRGEAARYAIAVECQKCKWRGVQAGPGRPVFPLPCPQCGERACHKLWECRSCGFQFVDKKGQQVVVCPRCGRRNVGTAEAVREPNVVARPQAGDPNGR